MTTARIRGQARGHGPTAWAALIYLASATGAAAQMTPPPDAPAPEAPLAYAPGPAEGGGQIDNGFRFVPRANLDLSVTDNVALTETNRKADFITSPTAGFNLSGGTPRTRITADASASYDFYGATTRFNGERITGLLNAKTDLFDRLLSLDARAATNQQNINPGGGSPAKQRSFGQNQAQVLTYGATPTVRWRFGDMFNAETSYDITAVNYYRAAASTTAVPANNTIDQTVTVKLVSGPAFSRLTWTADASLKREDRQGPNSVSDHRSVQGSLLFAVVRNFQIVGTYGYDDIVEPSLNEKLGGMHATGGIRWRLSPRTEINFDAGWRYHKPNYNALVTYSASTALVLHASYEQTIETPQSLSGRNLANLGRDPFGNLINPITGLPADPTDDPFGLSNQAFRRNALEAGISGRLGPTTYTVTGKYERRKTGLTQTKDVGGTVSIARKLSPHLTATLTADYDRLTGLSGFLAIPTSNKVDRLNGRARLDYALGRKTTVAVYYQYQRKLTFPGQIIENVGVLTLNRTF
jgi:uncharacterized protein (PEP-CTERM system associated)